MSFSNLASQLNGTGGPIVGRATVNPGGVGNAFGLHVVDVERSIPKPARWTSFATPPSKTPARRYIPATSRARYREALYRERLGAERGVLLRRRRNDAELHVPRLPDAHEPGPANDRHRDVEIANPGHPYGVRGVGEVSIVPPMAAVANAIHDATGVRNDQTADVTGGRGGGYNGQSVTPTNLNCRQSTHRGE